MLEIKDLHATVGGTEILKGLHLVVEPGEVHAIMGPNGSGKSTLSYVLAGREGYGRGRVAESSITVKTSQTLSRKSVLLRAFSWRFNTRVRNSRCAELHTFLNEALNAVASLPRRRRDG